MMPANSSVQEITFKMRIAAVLMERLSDVHSDIAAKVEEITKTLPPEKLPPDEGGVNQKVHGACDLQVWENTSGQFTFSFDLQKSFSLPARLAKALIFLATEAGEDGSRGGLLGFRSRTEFLAHLRKTAKPGKLIRPPYVNHVSSLLKAAILKLTGRDLISTNDDWGVRLLLKRGGLHGLEKTSAHKWL